MDKYTSIDKFCDENRNIAVDIDCGNVSLAYLYTLSFIYDDGRLLKYALPPSLCEMSVQQAFKKFQEQLKRGVLRGRLFIDGKFAAYINDNAKTLDEVLIDADMAMS